MKLFKATTLAEVAGLIGAKAIGAADLLVTGINEIHVVTSGDIAFVDHHKYYVKTLASAASVIIIDKEVACPEGKGLLVHPNPFDAFNDLTQRFQKEIEEASEAAPNIDPSAVVMPGAHIGNYVTIGANSVIHPGSVVYDHCVIGANVIIHANAVIGSDAFYFKRKPNHHEKLRSVGRVVIKDDVEIGAACTIDRGSTADTVIGKGSKLDNQVHVGHDTHIGERCLFAAQVGIAGCVVIGDGVVMWGQVGCAANVSIGDGTVVYAQSGIIKSLEAGQTYFGSPAIEAKVKMREIALIAQLSRKK
ncbi:MAG: UDP-3-O-(3-hydroxymyristoyl)glucosamine N-acyltransferase [Flavobacteriales bacterium]|nr:UDP-3-O-(3-hydroxymyristoyl)glucosamine N-acyltransferase [Flavobacteriales bacterium]